MNLLRLLKMLTFSEKKLIEIIKEGKPFEGALNDNSLYVKIKGWVPYVSTAIHAGDALRDDFNEKCALTKEMRHQEEDPYTDKLIESSPITIVGLNSRYEYDLNREPKNCIHKQVWDQKVWNSPLTFEQEQESIAKHACFYRILKVLIKEVVKRTGACMIVDLHSYNWQIRTYPYAPVFNIGTEQFHIKKFSALLETLKQKLSEIVLPNLDTTVEYNEVFKGKGYQAKFVKTNFPNVPLIPLEVKKIFMDEHSSEPFPLVIESLQVGLNNAILSTATHFSHLLGKKRARKSDLSSSSIEPIVLKIDKEIHRLSLKFDTLHYVNPINFQHERRLFFKRRDYIPSFRYRQLRVNPYLFREKLFALPISQILDPILRSLYRSIIEGYAAKTDLITSIGTPNFLYNSLRYYGEPSKADIANAHFLLHIKKLPEFEKENPTIGPEEAKKAFEEIISAYNINFSVQISNRLVAKAMVDPPRKVILINQNLKVTPTVFQGLLNHEFGIHVLTSCNAAIQPLRIFELGLPGNTYTQEGLAILSEYLSGNLSLERLKLLALRVVAIDMMVKGESFRTIYQCLIDKYNIEQDEAFTLTTRTFRGGGFTKDYLYLSGFSSMVALRRERSLSALMIGKTSLHFLDTIDNLLERKLLKEPIHLPQSFKENPSNKNPMLDFLIQNI